MNLGPAHSAFLASVEQSAKAFNLEVERLDAQGVMSRWPEITVPDDYIGLYEAHSGVLHCETAIKTGSTRPQKLAVGSCLTAR